MNGKTHAFSHGHGIRLLQRVDSSDGKVWRSLRVQSWSQVLPCFVTQLVTLVCSYFGSVCVSMKSSDMPPKDYSVFLGMIHVLKQQGYLSRAQLLSWLNWPCWTLLLYTIFTLGLDSPRKAGSEQVQMGNWNRPLLAPGVSWHWRNAASLHLNCVPVTAGRNSLVTFTR